MSILTITSVNGCTFAAPNFYFISRISPSTNADILYIYVYDRQSLYIDPYYPNTEEHLLFYSVSSNSISIDSPDNVEQVNLMYSGHQMEVMPITENNSGMFLHYLESENEEAVLFSFDITRYNFENTSMILGLLYEKHDRIYIREGTWGNETKQLIGSLSNNEIITNGTNIFPLNLMFISSELPVAFGSAQDEENPCGGLSYYKINDTGFEFIVSTTLDNIDLLNPINQNIHIVSHSWEGNSSKIKSFDIESGSYSEFTITAQELEILFISTTTNLDFFNLMQLFVAIVVVLRLKQR